MKKVAYLIVALLSVSFADDVEFSISIDDERYDTVMSLYNDMLGTDSIRLALQRNVISQKNMREESLETQKQFAEFAIENNMVTSEMVLEYFKAVEEYEKARMNYFQFMLNVVDNRAKCFLFYKSARAKAADANMIVNHFTPQETFEIEYSEQQKISIP